MTDTLFDPLENGNLTNNHYWKDYISANHVVIQRLVPELLGEFDNATEMQSQMAYVLACLRKLARDQSILKHEFDNVVDNLLATINKILDEFSSEITKEINDIWKQLQAFHLTTVSAGNDINVTTTITDGNITTYDYKIDSKVNVTGSNGVAVSKTDSTYNVTNTQTVSSGNDINVVKSGNDFKVNNLQNTTGGTDINVTKSGNTFTVNNLQTFLGGQDIAVNKTASATTISSKINVKSGNQINVTKLGSEFTVDCPINVTGSNGITVSQNGTTYTVTSAFLQQLYNNMVASGAYTGSMGTGSFNGNIAFGNINLFGGVQDGSSFIRTSNNQTANDIAGGIA